MAATTDPSVPAATGNEATHVRVVVVGAGLAGIAAAVKLKQAGLTDYVVLEKADRVGGTWRENTYPGCGCDIPAPVYSFSFNPKPQWRTNFALPRRLPESRDSRARCSTPRDGTTSWPDGQEGRRRRYRRLGGAVRARDRTRRGAAAPVSADPVLGGAAARLPVSHGGAGPVPAVQRGLRGTVDVILRTLSMLMRREQTARLLSPVGTALLKAQVPDTTLRAALTPDFTLAANACCCPTPTCPH